MTPLTKNKRFEIYRLTKRARGLYKAEKQALVFIGEAQTMKDGVCRKALKSVEDLGYGVRQTRFGLHGRRRNGKIEFPGLLARGIVSAVGHQKGGRAPGGHGLPTIYVINRDVLLTFIPETDDPPEKDEPKGERLVESLDEPKDEPMPTRSFNSHINNACPSGEPQGEASARTGVVDSDNSNSCDSPAAAPASHGAASLKSRATENQKPPHEKSGPHVERIIATSRKYQLDRDASDAEIRREYQAVFNQVTLEADKQYSERQLYRDRNISLEQGSVLKTNKKQWKEAADLYREIGRDKTMSLWEDFLVNDDHETTQPVELFDEDDLPTGKYSSEVVQRTWLLRDFLDKYGESELEAVQSRATRNLSR